MDSLMSSVVSFVLSLVCWSSGAKNEGKIKIVKVQHYKVSRVFFKSKLIFSGLIFNDRLQKQFKYKGQHPRGDVRNSLFLLFTHLCFFVSNDTAPGFLAVRVQSSFQLLWQDVRLVSPPHYHLPLSQLLP